MNLNDAASWAQILWFGAVTIGTIYGGIKFWIKFTHKLDNLEKYTYKENGGSSLKDSLNRLEKSLEANTKLTQKAFVLIGKLEGRLDNHIEENKK